MRKSLYEESSALSPKKKKQLQNQFGVGQKSLYAAEVAAQRKSLKASNSSAIVGQNNFNELMRPQSEYSKILKKNAKALQKEFEGQHGDATARRFEEKLIATYPLMKPAEREAFKVLIYIVQQMGVDHDETVFRKFMTQLASQAQQTIPTDPVPWVTLEVLKETVADHIDESNGPTFVDYDLIKMVYRQRNKADTFTNKLEIIQPLRQAFEFCRSQPRQAPIAVHNQRISEAEIEESYSVAKNESYNPLHIEVQNIEDSTITSQMINASRNMTATDLQNTKSLKSKPNSSRSQTSEQDPLTVANATDVIYGNHSTFSSRAAVNKAQTPRSSSSKTKSLKSPKRTKSPTASSKKASKVLNQPRMSFNKAASPARASSPKRVTTYKVKRPTSPSSEQKVRKQLLRKSQLLLAWIASIGTRETALRHLSVDAALIYPEAKLYEAVGDGVVLLEALSVISPYHFSQVAVSINRNTSDRYQAYTNFTMLIRNLTEYFKIKHGFYSPGVSTYQCNVIISREKVFYQLMEHEKRLVSMRSGLSSSRAQQFLSSFMNLASINEIMEIILGVALNSANNNKIMMNFNQQVKPDCQEALMVIARDVLVRVGKLRDDRADELEEQQNRRRLEARKMVKAQRRSTSPKRQTLKKDAGHAVHAQSTANIIAQAQSDMVYTAERRDLEGLKQTSYNNPYVHKKAQSYMMQQNKQLMKQDMQMHQSEPRFQKEEITMSPLNSFNKQVQEKRAVAPVTSAQVKTYNAASYENNLTQEPTEEQLQLAHEFARMFRDKVERDNIDVRTIFATHDVDQNMAVTPGEFRMLCSTINVGLDNRELAALKALYGNQKGEILYNDFMNVAFGVRPYTKVGDAEVEDSDGVHSEYEGLDPANVLTEQEEEEVIIALARVGTDLKKRQINFQVYTERHDRQRTGKFSLDTFKRFFDAHSIRWTDREYQLIKKRFADKQFQFNYADFMLVMKECVAEREANLKLPRETSNEGYSWQQEGVRGSEGDQSVTKFAAMDTDHNAFTANFGNIKSVQQSMRRSASEDSVGSETGGGAISDHLPIRTIDTKVITALKNAKSNGTFTCHGRSLKALPEELLYFDRLEMPRGTILSTVQRLSYVDVSNNLIQRLPDEPVDGALSKLIGFSAANNQIRFIPDSLFKIKTLQAIDLSGNRISFIPPTIREASMLKTIKMNNNQITELPSTLGQCDELEHVELQHNKIILVPEQMSYCTELRTLLLDHNNIKVVAGWLSRLINLQELSLSNNRIESYDVSAFVGLTKLKQLDLSHNNLTYKFKSIPRSDQLQRLNLSENYLTDIDDVTVCKNLIEINLDHNQFREVPESITRLTKLQTLRLSFNMLNEANPKLGHIDSLKLVTLEGNPLQGMHESMHRVGTDRLKAYWKLIQTDGAKDQKSGSAIKVYKPSTPRSTVTQPQEKEQRSSPARVRNNAVDGEMRSSFVAVETQKAVKSTPATATFGQNSSQRSEREEQLANAQNLSPRSSKLQFKGGKQGVQAAQRLARQEQEQRLDAIGVRNENFQAKSYTQNNTFNGDLDIAVETSPRSNSKSFTNSQAINATFDRVKSSNANTQKQSFTQVSHQNEQHGGRVYSPPNRDRLNLSPANQRETLKTAANMRLKANTGQMQTSYNIISATKVQKMNDRRSKSPQNRNMANLMSNQQSSFNQTRQETSNAGFDSQYIQSLYDGAYSSPTRHTISGAAQNAKQKGNFNFSFRRDQSERSFSPKQMRFDLNYKQIQKKARIQAESRIMERGWKL